MQEYDKKYILSNIDINNDNSLNRVISFAEVFFLINFGQGNRFDFQII